MKVLVVGGGGREHALCWKLAQSPRVSEVCCAPGNPGTAEVGTNLPVAATDLEGLRDAVRRTRAGLVVVGPEAPLVRGLGDLLKEMSVPVFGPTRAGAELEGSKAFAKDLMHQAGIPTASYRIFEEPGPARDYLEGLAAWPVVVKASGLAGGKGALICPDLETAEDAVKRLMEERALGEGGATVVVEEFLRGFEASIHCVTDGRTLFVLPSSQDYKRVGDGDRGPNTGGMGATSPCPGLDEAVCRRVEREVLFPTVHALTRERRPFRGMLYAGLMITPGGPRVLEYNVRFGDPETQVIVPRLRGDLLEVLMHAARGRLEELPDAAFEVDPRPAVTVVLAAEGYPASVRRGDPIEGVEEARRLPDVVVFQAGTALADRRLVTAGGRVLAVTALGEDLEQARTRAYEAASRISFRGMHLRRDVGSGRGTV